MRVSKREMVLAWCTLAALLLGGTYYFGEPKYEEWKAAKTARTELKDRITLAERVLSRREKTEQQLQNILSTLPKHPLGRDVTSQLLSDLQGLADKHNLTLLRREPGTEKKLGDLYELSVSCTWEGELESLIRFLYDLQSQGATFDIRQLTVQPARGSATRLKGSFSLDCAYSRS